MQTIERQENWQRFSTRPQYVRAFKLDTCDEHRLQLPKGVTRDGVDTASAQERFAVTVSVGGNEFRQPVYDGDWIIEKSDGSWCVCAGDIFEQGFVAADVPAKKIIRL